ncbi:MAG: CHASE2 domain-containing protein, partial [Leptolyngbya sp. SIO4C1]|nr:CHASE2 domain-containing protein [Leptolyngbya sp. SIO4C1]
MFVLRTASGLQALELDAFDTFVRLQPDPRPDPALLVVGITEADIKDQAAWPLSDQIIANLLAQLQAHEPKAIGLDIHRDVPIGQGATALAKQLQAENVFAITRLGYTEEDRVPPPPGMPPERVGYNDLVIDSDNILRRNWMFAAVGDESFYSFALRLSLYALAQQGIGFQARASSLKIGNTVFPSLQPTSGGYQKEDTTGYQVMLQYRSRQRVARQLNLRQVLSGDFDPDWVAGKIVLIGTVAPTIKDMFLTPYSTAYTDELQMPGVVVHAQMVSQILSAVLDR